jgi:response regulator RpfG family c-di-GMP phosphodiesterase
VKLLLVDDDAALRALLRATFESFDVGVEEAEDVASAEKRIAKRRPDVVVLDVHMPGQSGLDLTRRLKANAETRDIGVVLLTGADASPASEAEGVAAGADAYLHKPFSPLQLLAVADRLAGGMVGVPQPHAERRTEDEQLFLYARDLRHLLEIERAQRMLLQEAYHETISALLEALEQKDVGTRDHGRRVTQYALCLAKAVDSELAEDESTEYGCLFHDVGKMGVPDSILLKRGPLTRRERAVMQRHTLLGERMLTDVALLQGNGLRVVRSHHERWDGNGYPDRLSGDEIPLGARIFAVADTLDAVTTNRPYRRGRSWTSACRIIANESGRQFDPDVVAVFGEREDELKEIRRELGTAA